MARVYVGGLKAETTERDLEDEVRISSRQFEVDFPA